jgi:hypothetical protein
MIFRHLSSRNILSYCEFCYLRYISSSDVYYLAAADRVYRGFAAKAPAKILESVQAWGSEYNAVVEEDQMVEAVGGSVA